jgi:hypothetical protein
MSITGNNLPVYANNTQNDVVSITGSAGALASDLNGVIVYTAGSNGSRIYNVLLSTTDTSADNIFLYIKTNGGSICPIGQINIPASSGNLSSKVCIDALSAANIAGLPFDEAQKPYIELAPNASLKISLVASPGTGSLIYASAIGADY